jgi:hypothetical protein
MPEPMKARRRPVSAGPSRDGTFRMTPDEHRAAAAQFRQLVGDPKAQELAACHELLARVIQKRLDEQVPRSRRARGRTRRLCRII